MRLPDHRRGDTLAGVETAKQEQQGSAKSIRILRDDDARRRLNAELRNAKDAFSREAADGLRGVEGAGNRAMLAHLEVERIRQEIGRLGGGR